MPKGIYKHTKGHHINVIKSRRKKYGDSLCKDPAKINKRRSIALKGNQHTLGMKFPNRKKTPYTEQHKINIGLGIRGDKNPNWKGGVCPIKKLLRSCIKYRQWRSDVFTRDDFTCQECDVRGGNLEAHHILSFSNIIILNNISSLEQGLQCEELWNLNNGMTLCLECHSKTFKIYEKK